MKVREVYEAMLVELHKNFGAADLNLDDFLYYINKGIFQYLQDRYNVMGTNQQVDDDLNELLVPDYEISAFTYTQKGIFTYVTGDLPDDYMHLANCILELRVPQDVGCYTQGYIYTAPAQRLTAKSESRMLRNSWLRPKFNNPYFRTIDDVSDTSSKLSVTYGKLSDINGNMSDGIYTLDKVYVDYMKFPDPVDLTYEQLDSITDTSDDMQFRKDVCYQIIREAVILLKQKQGDPNLATYMQVTAKVPQQGGLQQAAQ